MKDVYAFYGKNLAKLKELAQDCPECLRLALPCTHYDYLKRYIAELEEMPPFDHEKFDAFWAAYPAKKAKAAVIKKWGKLKMDEELFQKIMTALEAHKKSDRWTKDQGEFIPHPLTWLNQERWEDELKITGQRSTKYKNSQ